MVWDCAYFRQDWTFKRDYDKLPRRDKQRFQVAVRAFVEDLEAIENRLKNHFRRGLRVNRVQGHEGVWKMTWASDGRATFSYGEPVQRGLVHIQWRRCGSHSIFTHP